MPDPLFLGVNYIAGGDWQREQYTNRTDGWDFGNPPPGWSVENRPAGVPATVIRPWEINLEQDLCEMWRNGISAIRWFVLGGGKAFGVGTGVPQLRSGYQGFMDSAALGALDNIAGWQFQMPDEATYAAIERDFIRMLEIVRNSNTNIRIVPALIDYRFIVQEDANKNFRLALGEPESGPIRRGPRATDQLIQNFNSALQTQGVVSGLRWSVIENPTMRTEFIENVVLRLARAVIRERLQDRILWWDIGNELDLVWKHPVRGSDGVLHGSYSVSHPVFTFVSEAVRAIHGVQAAPPTVPPTFPFLEKTTVGWLYYDTLGRLTGTTDTGEKVLQYHAYAHANGRSMINNRNPRQSYLMQTNRPSDTLDYLGPRPFWWEVPDIRARPDAARKIVIGEMATEPTRARHNIDCADDGRGSELWIGEFADPATNPGTNPIDQHDYIVMDTPRGRYVYSRSLDTLRARLDRVNRKGYQWVFLWEWNRPLFPVVSIQGRNVSLPRDPYTAIAAVYAPPTGSTRQLVGGFLRDLKHVNFAWCMDDVHHQRVFWPILQRVRAQAIERGGGETVGRISESLPCGGGLW